MSSRDEILDRLAKSFLDPYLWATVTAFILEYGIYALGYDHVVKWGPYVTHHFIEMPGFFLCGIYFGRLLIQKENEVIIGQIIHHAIFLGWLSFWAGLHYIRFLAGFLVMFPQLIGFYAYLIFYRIQMPAV